MTFRDVFMLALSVGVVLAMYLTLRWFFRRLRRIQEELWGKENVKPFRITFAFTRSRREQSKGKLE